MLVDVNLLVYAVNEQAAGHEAARAWLSEHLGGPRRVGLPWQSLGGFLRLVTHHRAFPHPLTPGRAWGQVTDWLAAPAAWIPVPGPGHATILGDLITRHRLAGDGEVVDGLGGLGAPELGVGGHGLQRTTQPQNAVSSRATPTGSS